MSATPSANAAPALPAEEAVFLQPVQEKPREQAQSARDEDHEQPHQDLDSTSHRAGPEWGLCRTAVGTLAAEHAVGIRSGLPPQFVRLAAVGARARLHGHDAPACRAGSRPWGLRVGRRARTGPHRNERCRKATPNRWLPGLDLVGSRRDAAGLRERAAEELALRVVVSTHDGPLTPASKAGIATLPRSNAPTRPPVPQGSPRRAYTPDRALARPDERRPHEGAQEGRLYVGAGGVSSPI